MCLEFVDIDLERLVSGCQNGIGMICIGRNQVNPGGKMNTGRKRARCHFVQELEEAGDWKRKESLQGCWGTCANYGAAISCEEEGAGAAVANPIPEGAGTGHDGDFVGEGSGWRAAGRGIRGRHLGLTWVVEDLGLGRGGKREGVWLEQKRTSSIRTSGGEMGMTVRGDKHLALIAFKYDSRNEHSDGSLFGSY